MAGFQQLRGQGFCHRRVLQWLRDLGVPLESPRVEFVLLCLQKHLGIVYGVVSRGQDLSDQTGRISRRTSRNSCRSIALVSVYAHLHK